MTTSTNARLLAALIASSAVAGLVPAAHAAEQAAPAIKRAPPAIRVVAAETRELVETLAVNGTIVAREEAATSTDLSGLAVVALNADIGDQVKKGDVLALLDRSMLDSKLAQMAATRAQAEASVAQMASQIADAEVSVRQADEGLERARALQDKGVAAKSTLDNAVNAADSARAKVETARKALEASKAQLGVIDAQTDDVRLQISKTELRAPADGLVLARDATLGGVVVAGGAPLFRIAIGSEFELAAEIAETALPRLSVGLHSKVTVSGSDAAIEGVIRRISPEVAQASRLGAIRIALPKDATVRAGSFGRGEIEIVRRNGVAVPASAVVYRGSEAFLQTVADGKVHTQTVRLGVRADGFVEVVSGLTDGQEVVSRAGTFVSDGDQVTAVRGEETGSVAP